MDAKARLRTREDAVLGVGSALVLLAALLLTPGAQGVALLGVELPPMCGSQILFGWDCPGCGLTRSFTYLARGQVVEGFRMNGMGPLLFLFVASQVPWRGYKIWRRFRTA